jgi:hypothetical protein
MAPNILENMLDTTVTVYVFTMNTYVKNTFHKACRELELKEISSGMASYLKMTYFVRRWCWG